jgi:hypothetical protein
MQASPSKHNVLIFLTPQICLLTSAQYLTSCFGRHLYPQRQTHSLPSAIPKIPSHRRFTVSKSCSNPSAGSGHIVRVLRIATSAADNPSSLRFADPGIHGIVTLLNPGLIVGNPDSAGIGAAAMSVDARRVRTTVTKERILTEGKLRCVGVEDDSEDGSSDDVLMSWNKMFGVLCKKDDAKETLHVYIPTGVAKQSSGTYSTSISIVHMSHASQSDSKISPSQRAVLTVSNIDRPTDYSSKVYEISAFLTFLLYHMRILVCPQQAYQLSALLGQLSASRYSCALGISRNVKKSTRSDSQTNTYLNANICTYDTCEMRRE